ncbi:hypothetical protein PR202_gb05609 [Eleusine coracana subsp. coracana]|uniref:E2 ubiquitin-conjugating enzyme n=1 Tax=Eleusine coracana subsp. coracana TaxID=191504 RepID=A0AAV5E884_ELECO|nr:hypothetical protein PR202_gb05609 [Eleusine coracana subsp. coracana]
MLQGNTTKRGSAAEQQPYAAAVVAIAAYCLLDSLDSLKIYVLSRTAFPSNYNMAQAARLNLRMQKEIKLLLKDPPHGVSLNLSEDESVLSSLSSIEARIEGPEGTVYSKGVFVLKIQIPERYPFQPPNVTFVTPIYHPNIDNGGRICLDILNLPPKGAWQPSINIATVLTSIGLLLSEPNPDDGLMAEISREYKYNRQVFDANAQLWTEKYANSAAIGASDWGSVDVAVLTLSQKLSLKSERFEKNTTAENQDPLVSHLPSIASSTDPTAYFSDVSGKNAISESMSINATSGVVSKEGCDGISKNLQLPGQRLSITSEREEKRKKLQLAGQRLSVTSVAPSQGSDGNDMLPCHPPTSVSNAIDDAMQSSDDVVEKSKSTGGSSDSSNKPLEGNRRNIRTLGLKLSLKSVKPENCDDQKENMAPNRMPSHSNFSNLQKRPLEDVPSKNFSEAATTLIPQNSSTKHQLPNSQFVSNDKCNKGRKKLCLLSKRLSLKPKLPETDRTCDIESTLPAYPQSDDRKLPSVLQLSAQVLKCETVVPNELLLSAPVFKRQPTALGSADSQKDFNSSNHSKQSTAAVENIVVSDSEDSEDECERPSRSRLSLMRMRLAGKLRN